MTSSEHDAVAAGAAATPGIVVDDPDDVAQVEALPPTPGLSFRGRGPDWWETGATYVEPGWLRTSRDPQVGTGNLAGGGACAVLGPCGRDLAPFVDHPEEQETVFLPGSRFTVVRQGELDGVWVSVVYVHRDDEPAPEGSAADTQVQRAATVLARARTLPPATVARPERFAGEFGVRR